MTYSKAKNIFSTSVRNSNRQLSNPIQKTPNHCTKSSFIITKRVEENYNNSQYFLGLHTGIMLLMILYNLVVFIFIRDKSYIFYILFLGLYTLASATIDGTTYEFLWGNYPKWNLVATRHLLGVAWIFYLLFTRDFLNTKSKLPKWNMILNIVCSISVRNYFIEYFREFG